ncbi:MAG: hypothetical protein RL156_828 [Bacteroidota bacterium]
MLLSITDSDSFASYLVDASNSGGTASRVFLPESLEHVQEAMRLCYQEKCPVHISGNGTGLVGGRVPNGGAVISLERLRSCTVDAASLQGTVQSGLSMREWQAEVSAHGVLYPPDPTEWSAAMGGTFATNASGARTFGYGPTRRYIEGLRVVLASGELLDLKRGQSVARDGVLKLRSESGQEYSVPVPQYTMPATRKHAAGYYSSPSLDAVDVFVGSEGTLGVIVEADVRLVPAPENVLGMIVFFTDSESLLTAVEQVRGYASGGQTDAPSEHLRPRLVEYFDERALRMIRPSYPQIPAQATGALWMEAEFCSRDEDAVLESWTNFLSASGALHEETWFALDDRRHAELRAFRHALPSAVYERVSNSGTTKIGTDIAVPPSAFRSFYNFYVDKFRENNVEYVLFGHIGDCHVHANIFAHDTASHERMLRIYDECIAEGLRLGGTVSAEHGIGKLKKRYLKAMLGPEGIEQMRAVKAVLDPQGILSPGNMFD